MAGSSLGVHQLGQVVGRLGGGRLGLLDRDLAVAIRVDVLAGQEAHRRLALAERLGLLRRELARLARPPGPGPRRRSRPG